jgi:hypothetical protein
VAEAKLRNGTPLNSANAFMKSSSFLFNSHIPQSLPFNLTFSQDENWTELKERNSVVHLKRAQTFLLLKRKSRLFAGDKDKIIVNVIYRLLYPRTRFWSLKSHLRRTFLDCVADARSRKISIRFYPLKLYFWIF